MNDAIKKERSPNYPKHTLEAALEFTKTLYGKIGKSKVAALVAVGALGYSGLNGATLTLLASLGAYGLVDRERGEGITVSALAIKIIHSTSDAQKQIALRESALRPSVFQSLFSEGFHHCGEDVLANHLIQKDFTAEGAHKAASVYLANYVFANLADNSIIESVVAGISTEKSSPEEKFLNNTEQIESPTAPSSVRAVTREYNFPLPTGIASLKLPHPFTEDDYDSLLSTIKNFKDGLVKKEIATLDCSSIGFEETAMALAKAGVELDFHNFDYSHNITTVTKIATDNGLRIRLDLANRVAMLRAKEQQSR